MIKKQIFFVFLLVTTSFYLHTAEKTDINPHIEKLQNSSKKNNSDTQNEVSQDEISDDDFLEDEEETPQVEDPWEGFNRAMFAFNDAFLTYFMKPLAIGYSYIIPRFLRQGIANVFQNAYMPIRFVNSLLQAKWSKALRATGRFTINTTVGVGGLWDPAKIWFGMEPVDEDTGQTLGVWGFGYGIPIHWAFLGPSSTRDTFGFVGDLLLKPQTYIVPLLMPDKPLQASAITIGIFFFESMNRLSLNPYEYDELKKDAPDPYIFFRDIYLQNREERVKR
ncbi:MAG: VacJ family lipoprotein [Candidatus Hydrogenedentota bacterium]|nr:MAG: VacJ family lipoprotein [Candidatus Hydrogenedentota bacterium]